MQKKNKSEKSGGKNEVDPSAKQSQAEGFVCLRTAEAKPRQRLRLFAPRCGRTKSSARALPRRCESHFAEVEPRQKGLCPGGDKVLFAEAEPPALLRRSLTAFCLGSA